MTHYVFHDAEQRLLCEKWMEGTKLHRLDGFAYIEYDVDTGFVKVQECRVHGILHAVAGLPSRVTYHAKSDLPALEEWHAHGKLSNFPYAASIRYATDGEWIEQKFYRNGVLHRLLGAAIVTRSPCEKSGGPFDADRQQYRVASIACFVNGKPHSSHGPQRVKYNPVRSTYKHVFNNVTFSNRYNVVYGGLMHPKEAEHYQQIYDVRMPPDIRGTECPICMKTFSTKTFKAEDTLACGAGVLLQCMKCKQAFHLRCVETWDASCQQSGTPLSCSVCRAKTGTAPMRVTAVAQKKA